MKARLIKVSALLVVVCCGVLCQSPGVRWHVVDAGGGVSTSGGGIMLQSSLGQTAVQAMAASTTILEGGFIPGLREYSISGTTFAQSLSSGWNLMSLPLSVNYARKSILYPGAVSPAFVYQGSYQARDTITNGPAFWLKFGSDGSAAITGGNIQQETLAVSSGWNMIGPASYPAPVSGIIPQNTSVHSPYFGYSSSYYPEDTLKPGVGYWVKVAGAGKLIMPSTANQPQPPPAPSAAAAAAHQRNKIPPLINNLGDVDVLTMRDADTRTANVYFITSAQRLDLNTIELPPPAPPGSIDVRFATNRMIEAPDNLAKTIPIVVQGMEYPLTLGWEMASGACSALLLVDGRSVALKGHGEVGIPNPESHLALRLHAAEREGVPKEFALRQNYPNPFNPGTTIQYDLPSTSRVILIVYNVLGQQVTALVDQVQEAGYKSVEWNGDGLASGVYFYRLQAAGASEPQRIFTQVKKMLLVR